MISGSAGSSTAATGSAAGASVRRDRFLALLPDTVILSVLDAVVNGTFGITRVTSGFTDPMLSGGFASFTTTTAVDGFWLLMIWVAYYTLFETLFGASPGKALGHLRVVDGQGRPATFPSVLVRNLIRPIDALPFAYLLGGALVLATRTHQRLGDRIAGTRVVRVENVAQPGEPRAVMRRRKVAIAAGFAVFLVICGAFQYWGRPPLVIQGLKQTGQLFGQPLSSYTLGQAQWGNSTVTYPITFTTQRTNQTCRGEIQLAWTFPGGWNEASGQFNCPPVIFP